MNGRRLSAWEWVAANLSRVLATFAWRVRVTPKLRERCVEYALRGNCTDAYNIVRTAEDIAQYIARGRS